MTVGHATKFIAASAVLCLAPCARCDTFIMKSGGTLEGAVLSERDGVMELELGYGTVSINRADVLRIKKTTAREREAAEKNKRLRTFASGKYVPRGASRLSRLLRTALLKREAALEARLRKTRLQNESAALETELAEHRENYRSLADKLQGEDPSVDRESYNATALELNKTGALLHSRELDRKALPGELEKEDARIQDYINAHSQFAEYHQGEGKRLLAREAQGIEGEFFSWVRSKIKVLRSDFKEEEAPSLRKGDQIIVNARINGKVPARLVVDTGASITVLYQKTTDALKLGPKAVVGRGISTVADGRSVTADVVLLDSLEVGGAKVSGTRAVLMPVRSGDVDGLLGMSFLGNFSVRVDSANGKLFLTGLK